MAIKDRTLTANTRLVGTYKGKAYTCLVVKTKEGLRFNVTKKGSTKVTAYKSLSASIIDLSDGHYRNGWTFWSREAEAKAKATDKAAKAKARGNGATPARPMIRKNGKDGKAWCEACCASFTFDGDKLPTECPEGHKDGEEPGAGS